ncbi:hypothetical protein ZWY2020_014434 [Hordeum vulgare]|nr:hypothetical protein ZWY2020_014434 [Hordeum vulgare]
MDADRGRSFWSWIRDRIMDNLTSPLRNPQEQDVERLTAPGMWTPWADAGGRRHMTCAVVPFCRTKHARTMRRRAWTA